LLWLAQRLDTLKINSLGPRFKQQAEPEASNVKQEVGSLGETMKALEKGVSNPKTKGQSIRSLRAEIGAKLEI
jgi:hypothetical protein